MADEPSIPMDQEEEDNDEYFSARESPGKPQKEGDEENLKSSTPTPQRSTRDGRKQDTSPSGRNGSNSGKSGRQNRQQGFISDENAQQGTENSAKKSEKVRRMLKDRNRWDMREYKKEELESPAKAKKGKKKRKPSKAKKGTRVETEEKSKTDEESDDKDETKEPGPSSDTEKASTQARSFFQSQQLILKCKVDKPIAPKCTYNVLRFAKTQEVVEYDSEGMQHLLGHYNERAISNPWRRWGAHRALCDQGGFLVDKNKKIVEIKRGSDPPPCPPNPRQVTLNKNCEAPDSQTMMGMLRVMPGPAEDEVHRIARQMEDYVKSGGFVPPPMLKKKPVVVLEVKGGVIAKPKRKNSKPKKKKNGDESDATEEDGENAKKPSQEPSAPPPQQPRDDSKKGGGAYAFFRKAVDKGKKAVDKAKGTKRSVR